MLDIYHKVKGLRPLFSITYILGGIAFFCLSCNSTKIPPTEDIIKENYILLITLKDELSGGYISDNYQAYLASNPGKSNKTLNQYQVNFLCSEVNFKKLQQKLANDASIISFSEQNSNNNIQSGKNEKYGKSKPIRDKN